MRKCRECGREIKNPFKVFCDKECLAWFNARQIKNR